MNFIGKRSNASFCDFFVIALKFDVIACSQGLGFYIDHMRHQIGKKKAGFAVLTDDNPIGTLLLAQFGCKIIKTKQITEA